MSSPKEENKQRVYNVPSDVNNAVFHVNEHSADRWSAKVTGISAGEKSAHESIHDDSDGFERTGSRRKARRLRIEQQDPDNSPSVSLSNASVAKLPRVLAIVVQASSAADNERPIKKTLDRR